MVSPRFRMPTVRGEASIVIVRVPVILNSMVAVSPAEEGMLPLNQFPLALQFPLASTFQLPVMASNRGVMASAAVAAQTAVIRPTRMACRRT